MARRSADKGEGKIRFRVIEFEVEGNSDALHESVKAISSALAKGGSARQQRLGYTPNEDNSGNGEPVEADVDDHLDDDDSGEPKPSARRRSTAPRKPRAMKILSDVDLVNQNPPLREYLTNCPDVDSKRYVLIGYWYKHIAGLADVTPDHIYTAYRAMSWHTPKDPGQPFRDLVHKNGWFDKAEGKGAYTINHIGENEVLKIKNAS